ncbi:MAG: aminotransferase class V-fold PLP-dependent enzyme [Desulfurococcales archaeon]|nr:aminotransferase class V-fold PLP-dependent enzyme [Desulfurococcales archaeon]
MKLLTPGPVMARRSVLEAASRQVISHRGPAFRGLMRGLQEKLAAILGLADGMVAVMPGSGTTAVDSMLWSLIPPRSRVTVLSWGDFGERIAKSLQARGATVRLARAPWGQALSLEEALEALEGSEYAAVVHNETSTGVAYRQLKRLAEEASGMGVKLLVDTVSGLGGEHLSMEWGIYAAATCSHKAIAAPPGVGMVALSREALKDLRERGTQGVPPILDLDKYRRFLEERMETPFTPPVNTLYALDKALEHILQQGIRNHIEAHRERAAILYNAGPQPLPPGELRSNTVVALKVQDAHKVKEELERRGYIIAHGMGKLKNTIVRIGTMGDITTEDIRQVAEILASIITRIQY